MIAQGRVTMEYKRLFMYMFIFMLMFTIVAGAKEIKKPGTYGFEKDKINKHVNMTANKIVFDKGYKLSQGGLEYHKKNDLDHFKYNKSQLKSFGMIWIDKKVGNTYHVDSLFIDDSVDIILEFYYNTQPDYIDHYNHSGYFVKRYYPNNWNWTANCTGFGENMECYGGYVTFYVENIDYGTGSNTFPIGITGATRVYNGSLMNLVSGTDFTFISENGIYSIINPNYNYTYLSIDWGNNYTKTSERMINNFTLGIDNINNEIPNVLMMGAVLLLFGVIALLINKSLVPSNLGNSNNSL